MPLKVGLLAIEDPLQSIEMGVCLVISRFTILLRGATLPEFRRERGRGGVRP